jgi:hypothetical protein
MMRAISIEPSRCSSWGGSHFCRSDIYRANLPAGTQRLRFNEHGAISLGVSNFGARYNFNCVSGITLDEIDLQHREVFCHCQVILALRVVATLGHLGYPDPECIACPALRSTVSQIDRIWSAPIVVEAIASSRHLSSVAAMPMQLPSPLSTGTADFTRPGSTSSSGLSVKTRATTTSPLDVGLGRSTARLSQPRPWSQLGFRMETDQFGERN